MIPKAPPCRWVTSPRREDLRWHDLRHTDAVLAAQTGAILAELMGRLGQPHQASPCGTSAQLPTAALRSPDGYLNWLGLRRWNDAPVGSRQERASRGAALFAHHWADGAS